MRAIHTRGGIVLLYSAHAHNSRLRPGADSARGDQQPETYFTQAAGTVIARITQTAEGSGANPTETIPEATAAATEIQLPTSGNPAAPAERDPSSSGDPAADGNLSPHTNSAAPAAIPALQPG